MQGRLFLALHLTGKVSPLEIGVKNEGLQQ